MCEWDYIFDNGIKKVMYCIDVSGTPSHSYGVSLAIWDHAVLPSTRHK